jgi:thiol-disulfide isomerase/thioredoxin
VLVAVALLTTAACTGSSGDPGPGRTFQPGPQRGKLIARAGLDPCRVSTAPAVDGGLPDVTLACLGDGPAVHLAGLRGPLVVNMWGSWCVPCRREMPFFAQAAADLRSRVQFLGVDTDDSSDSALDFAAHVRPRLRYPSVVDENKAVLIGLRLASAVPSTVFVDRAGKVVHRSLSDYESAQQLHDDIARYLGVTR